eukprot:m.245462 g.245462  ORF g.245462 m.245462 type:complete len:53 (+) comp40255_c0_seq25:222-380(+)
MCTNQKSSVHWRIFHSRVLHTLFSAFFKTQIEASHSGLELPGIPLASFIVFT